jgi:membrane-bound serine protease (ClpP class)
MTLPILLLGLGLVFALAEIFVPSMGILTLLSAASVIASVVMAFGESTAAGLWFLLIVAVAVPATVAFGFRLFPRTPIGRRMVSSGLSFESTRATDARDLDLVGRDGVTLSDLRPAGFARIGDRRVDVVARGESIPSGTAVRVLEVTGNRVVVIRAPEAADDGGAPAEPQDGPTDDAGARSTDGDTTRASS